MATIYVYMYPLLFSILVSFFFINSLAPVEPSILFSFEKFDTSLLKFDSKIGVYCDAILDVDELSIKMTNAKKFSGGIVTYQQPIKIMEEKNPKRKGSFRTHFSFSMSPDKNEFGIMFVMSLLKGLPNALTRDFIGVKINIRHDDTQLFGNSDAANHVGLYASTPPSAKFANAADANLVLDSGERLQLWLDYEATSKRVEVRVAQWGKKRPVDPLLWLSVNLSKMFNTQDVFLTLASITGNSTQVCKLYSWSFELRT
ncbi:hypothetical protein BVRB_5g102060 [Beta vulgaris subsp. vulgaris]|nr:hypothetical protein BVRB_5g102060 [Beta vulgaris subsp. vulgaris]